MMRDYLQSRYAKHTAVLAVVAALWFAAGCERRPASSDGDAPAATPKEIGMADPPTILALGDSITAGYGVGDEASYPARLQQRLGEEGYFYKVVNAGVSGDTSAGGLARTDWLLRQPAAIMILELGGNDALRGQEPGNTRDNLAKIIEKAQAAGVRVVLAGMRMPANYGADYQRRFAALYPELAERYDIPLIPFILEGVAGHRNLTLPDAIHPNEEGYKIVLETVWQALEPVLKDP